MKFKKFLAVALLMVLLCGCSGKPKLEGGRWYIDDINSTVRTVVEFEKDTGLISVCYVLIDEGRAERTGVSNIQYEFEKYRYTDYGENIPKEYNDGTDTSAFAVYDTEEDFKAKENPFVTYYHFEGKNLVVNGNVCLPLEGELAEETDRIIEKNKAAIGE